MQVGNLALVYLLFSYILVFGVILSAPSRLSHAALKRVQVSSSPALVTTDSPTDSTGDGDSPDTLDVSGTSDKSSHLYCNISETPSTPRLWSCHCPSSKFDTCVKRSYPRFLVWSLHWRWVASPFKEDSLVRHLFIIIAIFIFGLGEIVFYPFNAIHPLGWITSIYWYWCIWTVLAVGVGNIMWNMEYVIWANGPSLGPVRSVSADRRREKRNKMRVSRKYPTKLVDATACCLLSPLMTSTDWILREWEYHGYHLRTEVKRWQCDCSWSHTHYSQIHPALQHIPTHSTLGLCLWWLALDRDITSHIGAS